MLFSSFTFLCFFLPLVAGIYYLLPTVLRNGFLLIASLFFYAWGEPGYLILMLGVALINYAGAFILSLLKNSMARWVMLCIVIALNLGIFVHFKYAGFILMNVGGVMHLDVPFLEMILPIGISFYTFQALSYVIDVYTGDGPVQKNPMKLLLYICLFPQLIAGPIVKYHDIYQQIEARKHSFDLFISGFKRFIIGLGKKIIVANTLGVSVDKIFALPVESLSPEIAWVGAFFYMLQLYFDFSGYSDMAVGLGRMFGFKFMENFNYPYISKSVQEFWRRWHISLSTWFKQYVYIPLGGNRVGSVRLYMNLIVVFLLTGLWHGAAWTFILWGLWHGAFIILEKMTRWAKWEMAGFKGILLNSLQHIYLWIVVCVGWVIFRSDTVHQAMQYILMMFHFIPADPGYGIGYYVGMDGFIAAGIGCICAAGLFKGMLWQPQKALATLFSNLYLTAVFCLSLLMMMGSTYNPFIYFRF